MSPINVHVTRYAVSGKINNQIPSENIWLPGIKASTENERTTVVIDVRVW